MYVLFIAWNCVATSSFAMPFAPRAICGRNMRNENLTSPDDRGGDRKVYAQIKIECRDFVESIP